MRREARPPTLRLGRVMLVAAALTVLLAAPGTACAAGSLVSATPGPGAVLDAAPDAVVLRFAGTVSAPDSHVTVSTADGGAVAAGEVEQPGSDLLRVPIRGTAPGDLTVAYHVVLLDGGSVSGAYRFSAGTGIAPAPLTGAAERVAASAVAGHVHQVDPASAVLLVIDGVVLLAVLVLLRARPRGGRPETAGVWRYRQEQPDP